MQRREFLRTSALAAASAVIARRLGAAPAPGDSCGKAGACGSWQSVQVLRVRVPLLLSQ